MKKFGLIAIATVAAGLMTAQAQQTAIWTPTFGQNWSIGVDGGVTTPLTGHSFFGSMRGAAGLHIQKQLTPVFGLGVEGVAGVNTSSWNGPHSSTVFDNSYVGAYGTVNLMNLFGGYNCSTRPFDIEALAGAGWGHDYYNKANGVDQNYFASKAGLNFNFHPSQRVTISVKPSVVWNMTGTGYSPLTVGQTTAAYDVNKATFQVMAGVSVALGEGFQCVKPYNQAEIDALNANINALRAEADAATGALAASQAENAALAAQILELQNQPQQMIVEQIETNTLQSVRYVFFRIGSSKITADQQPNIEMISDYLKHNPEATVTIKGYASQDGNLDFNIKLAQARAESVKNALVKRGIKADRIKAEGEGIGKMFKEESWNRVSICTLDD